MEAEKIVEQSDVYRTIILVRKEMFLREIKARELEKRRPTRTRRRRQQLVTRRRQKLLVMRKVMKELVVPIDVRLLHRGEKMATGRDQGVPLTILAEKKIETDERVVVALINVFPPARWGENMAITGRCQVMVPKLQVESDLGLNHQKNKSLCMERVNLILVPRKLRV